MRHIGQNYFADFSAFRVIVTNIISPVAVPIFFVVSGFLTFKTDETDSMEARLSINGQKLKKQIVRILKLYLIWSIVYFPLTLRGYIKEGISIQGMFIDYIKNAIFNGTYYHLWYLPSLIFALAIVYLLYSRLNTKKIFILGIILYIIGCVADTYNFEIGFLKDIICFYKKIFITTRNGLFFGFIYVFIGKLIANNKESLIKYRKILFVLLIISVILFVFEGYMLAVVYRKVIINMNFMSIPLSLSIVALAISKKKYGLNLLLYREMSTMVFCCHPLIIYLIDSMLNYINVYLNIYQKGIVIIVSTTIISYITLKIKNKV